MTGNCPTAPVNDTNYCIKPSGNSSLSYNVGVNGTTFSVRAIKDSMSYAISDATAPVSTVNTGTSTDWINIGSQTWAKNNLNIGTIITGITNQTNNSVLEKYCFNNLESNCDTYGALYQWNEAMQYSNTEGTQGICPVGSHIPSDSDWKKLEMQIGLTQSEANIENDWRGTDQGAQLKSGGSSGLSLPFAGGRYTDGSFFIQTTGSFTWSSTELGSDAWHRYLHNNTDQVGRYTDNKGYGFSVRCLAN